MTDARELARAVLERKWAVLRRPILQSELPHDLARAVLADDTADRLAADDEDAGQFTSEVVTEEQLPCWKPSHKDLIDRLARAEAENEKLRDERGHLVDRIEAQRRRLATLETIVADHANHYRVPIEHAAEAARRHIVAWQDQWYRANRAEAEVERLRADRANRA